MTEQRLIVWREQATAATSLALLTGLWRREDSKLAKYCQRHPLSSPVEDQLEAEPLIQRGSQGSVCAKTPPASS